MQFPLVVDGVFFGGRASYTVLLCTNSSCKTVHDRDVNAAKNILLLTQCILNGSPRPAYLSPLHLAAEWGNCSVVTQLLCAGANANARASDGDASLHIAICHSHVDVARVLIHAGVDVNARNDTSWTPLHVAAVEGHTSAMTLLLEHGALVDTRDESGSTPLHVSAFFDENGARFARSVDDTQVAVVNLLLASGADPHLCDARGMSPAKRAKRERYDVIVDVLQSHLVDRMAPTG